MPPPRQPSLVIITGRPGSGKTTLAHTLANTIHCPAICRDELKEGLMNTLGEGVETNDQITRQIYDSFFETIEVLLKRRISLIAEAAFQNRVWAPKLEPFKQFACLRTIVCTLDKQFARARRLARSRADPSRDRFHPDAATEDYDPPRIAVPTLNVDTSDGYRPSLETITSFARGGFDSPAA